MTDTVQTASVLDLHLQDGSGDASYWLEQARVLHARGQYREAAALAEQFAASGATIIGSEDRALLGELGDLLFEAGERRRSGPIYAVLHKSGPADAKIVVRYAEALIEAGEATEALGLLRSAQDKVALDLWGRRALAECESLAGHSAAALGLARDVLGEQPDDAGFLATYLDVLVRAGDPALLRQALSEMAGSLPSSGARELEVRLHGAEGRPAEAAGILLDSTVVPQSRLFHLALDHAYAALAAGDAERAQQLSAHLLAQAEGDVAAALLHVNLLLHRHSWEEAEAYLSGLPADQLGLPAMLLKRFEVACFTGRSEEAGLLRAELEAGGALPREAIVPVLRYLAERQQWSELAGVAIAWLGLDFRYDQIGYVLFRAAQRTGLQQQFLAAIQAAEGWRDSPDLVRLYSALAWDAATTLAQMDGVLAGADAGPAMQHRMRVERAILADATRQAGRHALFLCTDAAYLAGSIVALHSALDHSTPGRLDVFLAVDDALAARAEQIVQPFRTLGFPVTVLAANELVGPSEKLDAAYGLFTSGHRLSSAAYYRIHCARYLHRLGGYARAVYLDSDVLVLKPLEAMFTADLGGRPLAARVETPRAEVARALALHRLQAYFNSGVLLLDLTSEHLLSALEGALAAIADDGVTLLLHDQCALNLGFRDRFAALSLAWNTPVTQNDRADTLPDDIAVLHYLDRPKPWSAAYEGPYAALWLDRWSRTAALIGAEAAVELLAMATD